MSDSNGNGKNALQNARLAPPGKGGTRLRIGPGIGGKKGRSGRKPDEFNAACALLADDAVRLGYVSKILKQPDHAQFMSALKWATDRGYGAVQQSHAVTGKDGGPVALTVRYVREGQDA